eukprot:tig00020556_g11056.t1
MAPGGAGAVQAAVVLFLSSLAAAQQSQLPPGVCPPGYDCTSFRRPRGIAPYDCPQGWLCLQNTPPRRCREGMYCPPGGREELPCPRGAFCRAGYAEPIPCESTYICPEGSRRGFFFGGVILLVLGALALLGLHAFVRFYEGRFRYAGRFGRVADAGGAASPPAPPGPGRGRGYGLSFEGLGFSARGRPILSNLNGAFPAAGVHAILGPSGAGKSVLLQLLAGKLAPTAGRVLVGGRPVPPRSTARVGYVPQDDVMLRDLTVMENLMYSAKLRLPAEWSDDQRRAQVEWCVERLGLSEQRHRIVGDEREGSLGVSGGQRKRVSVGLELVAAPDLLLVDEGTSGLDATTAQDVFALFRGLAGSGVTVVNVIHQPRFEIFREFDVVALLGPSPGIPGGRLAYLGPPGAAEPYFASLGFPCPKLVNPADHMVDLLAGAVPPSDEADTPRGPPPALGPAPGSRPREEEEAASAAGAPARGPGFLRQLAHFAARSADQAKHATGSLVTDVLTSAIAGLILGIAFEPQSVYVPPIPLRYRPLCLNVFMPFCTTPEVDSTDQLARFFTMAVGLISVTMGVRTFGRERGVFWRECGAGLSPGAYFLARCLADLPTIAVSSLTLTSVYVMTASPVGPFGPYLGAVLLLEFAAFGVGYCASALVVIQEGALLLAATAAMIAGLGVQPNFAGQFCWGRWAGEALFNAEVRRERMDAESLAAVVAYVESSAADRDRGQSYRFDQLEKDLLVLLGFGLAARLLAFLVLRLSYPAKRR